MRRQPAIHINKTHLALVLKQLLVKENYSEKHINKLAGRMMGIAKQYSISTRSLVIDKAKLLKSTSRVVLSTRDDAGSFAQLLLTIRRQRHHKGIALIKPGSRDWLQIKEIAKLAIDFCNDFDILREAGFKIYINLALDKMVKYSLMKFNGIHQSICEDYQALQIIQEDITPTETNKVKDIYEKYLGEKGIQRDYSKSPDKYVYFIKVKEECNKIHVSYNDYIKSQFVGLEWCNGIPDPAQLVGPKATDRLNRYLVTHNIKPAQQQRNNKVQEATQKLLNKWRK